MHAPRKAATILIGAAIVSAAMAWGAQGQPATSQPDLTVSVNAVPNPVPFGMGYEVQIIVANTIPPARLTVSPLDTPHADPIIPVPPGLADGGTERGADVQHADLLLHTSVPPHQPVAVQTQPPLDVSCRPTSIGESRARCTIGPLKKGGRWTITFVYPNPGFPPPGPTGTPGAISYGATIDDLNKIAERDEGNNSEGVTVNFEALTAALDLITPRGLVSAPPSGGNQLTTVFVGESISLLGVGRDGARGVKRTSLTRSITRACGNLQTGLGTNQTFSSTLDASDSPPGNSGPPERFVQDSVLVADLLSPCGPAATFRALNFSAFVTAENYHGGIVRTGEVSFRIAPLLRVATFNLASSSHAPLSRAGLLVKEADVVFLQEVAGASQATALANMSGLSNVHYYEDLAIVSRFPLSNVVEHKIPRMDNYVVDATITVDGMMIRLLNSHFPYSSCYQGEREDLRVAAAQFVLSLVEQTPNLPILFGADINGNLGSPEVNL